MYTGSSVLSLREHWLIFWFSSLQAMQGSSNQMMPQMPQHLIGMNQTHPGNAPPNNMPPMGGFPNGMGNIQGASGSPSMQNYPMGGMYNRPQGQMAPQGQMSIPGLGSYQV